VGVLKFFFLFVRKVCARPFDTISEAALVLFLRRKPKMPSAGRLLGRLIFDPPEPASTQWFRMKGENMSTEKKSAGEIQQAIKQGAITREYKADAKRVIQALNGLRSTEVMSYLQYMQHQYMAVSLLSPGMKAEFQAHATQELDHANRLAERIQQLGGVPIYDPKEIAQKAANVGVVPEQGGHLN
jgi:hypothetical protein